MNKLVTYLESKEAIFHGALVLIILYVPHAGNLFMQLEHLDMSFSGYSFLNWLYGVALAGAIEFLILVFIINGYKKTGKFYAVVSFFLNTFYYNYWFIAMQAPTPENLKSTVISLFICLTHSLAVWQLSELFYKRLKEDKAQFASITAIQEEEFQCPYCEKTPFPSKRALDGHISKVHGPKSKLNLNPAKT